MPLTEKVAFTANLQAANTVQVPKLVRWRFKMECTQPLKVGVNFLDQHRGWQFFYAKIRKDGRLTIPKLVLSRFQNEKTNLTGNPAEITLEPA